MTPGGANAAYLATTYATNGDERISGAAAFGQTAAPIGPDPVDPVDPVDPPPGGGDTGTNTGFTGTRSNQFTFIGNSGAMGTGDAALRDGFLTGFTSPHSLADEIGRASWRERVCQYVEISLVAVSLKKKK